MEHNPFVALLLITGLALLIPVLLSRFRRVQLPIVVGEILAGVVIGTSGLNLVEDSPTLDFLAEFGFAYLMFLSGLEVDFSLITRPPRGGSRREAWSQPVPMALLILALTLSLAVLAAFGLRQLGMIENPLLMGLILSTTSLGIVAPVLKERRLLGDRYGQSLLVAATLADFVTLLLLTVVIAAESRGLTLDLLLIPVLLLVFVLVARTGQVFARLSPMRRVLEELSHATAQIRVRGALALMVAWVVLAEALGVELILGAFLAGAIANLMAERSAHDAQEKLDAIGYGFFIPIFFIMVGANLNLRVIFDSPGALLLVPMLLLIAFSVKLLPALVLRARFSWRDTLAGGVLLSARLSLIIAASEIARDIGAISEAIESSVVVVAVITSSLSPLLFNRLYRPHEEARRRGLIIVGSNQMTELLARRFAATMQAITVVSRDPEPLTTLAMPGLRVITGSAAEEAVLRQAGAEQAEAMIMLSSDNAVTLAGCTLAREHFGIPLVVAGVNETEMIPRLQALGVRVVQPALATAMALEGALRFPTAFDVLDHQAGDVEIGETVLYNPAFLGRPLRRVRLPGNVFILSVRRDHTVMVPNGNTILQAGDSVALVGSPDSVREAIVLLAG